MDANKLQRLASLGGGSRRETKLDHIPVTHPGRNRTQRSSIPQGRVAGSELAPKCRTTSSFFSFVTALRPGGGRFEAVTNRSPADRPQAESLEYGGEMEHDCPSTARNEHTTRRGRDTTRTHRNGGSGNTPLERNNNPGDSPGLPPHSTPRNTQTPQNEPTTENTHPPRKDRHTPQTAGTTNGASTSHSQETGQRASSHPQMNDPPRAEPRTTANREHPRPRNVPRETLTQPRRQKQSLKIACLNMNGTGSKTDDKWGAINNIMKQRKIAVLAIQESHPSEETQRTIQRRFQNSLQIYHSADPDEPGTRNGVSFAVNKRLVKIENIEPQTVMEGRAMSIEVPWNGEDTLRIMNVYAPAKNNEKAAFWEQLLQNLETEEKPEPDVVMGDFNIVENPEIDRLKNSGTADPANARESFSNFATSLNLADGWRRRHQRKRSYTYIGRTQSRIDRIYTKEEIIPWCTDWKIEHPAVRTDHQLVSVNLTHWGRGGLETGDYMLGTFRAHVHLSHNVTGG